MIAGSEYRFDRVPPGDLWACLVWESARELVLHYGFHCAYLRHRGNMWTGYVSNLIGFPGLPWLSLQPWQRQKLAQRYRDRSEDEEDGCDALAMLSEFDRRRSAAEWRTELAGVGCAILDFGQKGRHTKAQLEGRFRAWLNANPDWYSGDGDGRVVDRAIGKRSPDDILRRIAWVRLLGEAGREGRRKVATEVAVEMVNSVPEFRLWLGLPTGTKRSLWKSECRVLVATVCGCQDTLK